ncbi:hypothetical protein U9M48_029624 [Paspalum notatum var. saurae]|uniref:Uncharacterized protein n=1 Tax=Paspalum notatum var. saurae TaxID=547442 RepID=A0AAQ3X2C9_PASNO
MGILTRRVGAPEPLATLPAGEEASGTTCSRDNWATFPESAVSSPTKKLILLPDKLRTRQDGQTEEEVSSQGFAHSDDGVDARSFSTSPARKLSPTHVLSLAEDSVGSEVGSEINTSESVDSEDRTSACSDFTLPRASFPESALSSPTLISLSHEPHSRQDRQTDEEASSPGFAHSDDGVDAHSFSTSPGRKERPTHVVSFAEDSVGSNVVLEINSSESVDSEDRTSACSDFTLPRSRACLGCNKQDSASLCNKCTGRLKIALLEARKSHLATGRFSYCLQCCALSEGKHDVHNSDCIPLDVFHGSQVAWVTKKEKWSGIFAGVQSDRHWNRKYGRPFLLHTPQGQRCHRCHDHLSDDKLYGTLILFCTIECWAESAEAAAEYDWVSKLLHTDFERLGVPYDAFCITCRCAFSIAEDDAEHQHEHEHLSIFTDFTGGTAATKVEIPTDHFMAGPWKFIKDLAGGETLSSPNHLFRLRDEGAQRCRRCSLRLEDGSGDTCSLECALRDPLMLPRSLQTQY